MDEEGALLAERVVDLGSRQRAPPDAPETGEEKIYAGEKERAMSVKVRYEDGEQVPAVNVKPPPLFHRLPADLQAAPQSVIDSAFEEVAREWWEDVAPGIATRILKTAFKEYEPEVRQVGRSGGHLAVFGIGTPDDWSVKQDSAWTRFEKAIKKSIQVAEKTFHERIREIMQ